MDLANMRENGVRSIHVACLDCHHDAEMNMDPYPGRVFVQSFAERMKCAKCGGRNVTVMPAWRTKPSRRQ
jgi:hypothetical protein